MADLISRTTADKALGVALNGLTSRQRAISNNLANVDTPGFKASQVRFEEQLQNAIAGGRQQSPLRLVSTNPGHLLTDAASVEDVQPDVVRVNNTTVRVDGNNVDIDKEMVQLADTTLSYNALVQLTATRISLTRYIVNEGRR